MSLIFNGTLLTVEFIEERLKPYAGSSAPLQVRDWMRAAVLVPLFQQDGEWNLLYMRRTETVYHHKGQVSFPGGAVEPVDRSLEETALRESQEEIGLQPDDVRILGRLPDYHTISDYLITPVVATILRPFEIRPSPAEVERVFAIPLRWLCNSANHEERPLTRPDGRIEDVIYYQLYTGELLWGITARITITFLQILDLLKK
jgi:8-oxo-dGTP pyrophosphatase MutT (NUDIX family)